jgi:hypothetical protein
MKILLTAVTQAFTGEIPLSQYDKHEVWRQVVRNNRRPDRPENSQEIGLSDEIWEILQACWHTNPHRRPKMSVVVKVFAKALGIIDPEEVAPVQAAAVASPPKDGNEVVFKVCETLSVSLCRAECVTECWRVTNNPCFCFSTRGRSEGKARALR